MLGRDRISRELLGPLAERNFRLLAAPLPIILGSAFVAGTGLELYGLFWETTLQQHIPEETLSRVSSYDVLGSFALIPVGVAFMGPISHLVGVENTLIGAALVVVLATAAVVAVADVRNLRPARGRARSIARRRYQTERRSSAI